MIGILLHREEIGMTKEEIENSIRQYKFSVSLYNKEINELESRCEIAKQVKFAAENRIQVLTNSLINNRF